MNDPYKTLGVSKSASQDEIKSAYRKLAKKLHPDLNPNDKKVEKEFKEVSAAYHILSDKDRRAKFDRGEGDERGSERAASGFWKSWTSRGKQQAGSPFGYGADFDTEEDIFAEFFRSATQGRGGQTRARAGAGGGAKTGGRKSSSRASSEDGDVTYKLTVPFIEAAGGVKKRVTLSDGRSLDLRIPPGTENGQTLRLKGQGRPHPVGTDVGDAFIEITVTPDPLYQVDGQDISIDVPITLDEAVLGGSITVPTIHGKVTVKVPEGSNTGSSLRLKGKGMPGKRGKKPGDQFVRLRVILPEKPDKELIKFLQKWSEDHGYNPRHKLGF